jgi:hypothetical protein
MNPLVPVPFNFYGRGYFFSFNFSFAKIVPFQQKNIKKFEDKLSLVHVKKKFSKIQFFFSCVKFFSA